MRPDYGCSRHQPNIARAAIEPCSCISFNSCLHCVCYAPALKSGFMMEKIEWFHGALPEHKADALLAQHGMSNGLFLVRENRDKQLTLSMAHSVSKIGF